MLTIGLSHRFDDFALDVDITAGDGITMLFGPSGAGKSTIAKAVGGLLRTDRAYVQLGERTLADTAQKIWLKPHARRIGYVFQEPRLFPHLSVRGNLLYGAAQDTDLVRIADLLDITPLLARRPAGLSGGEAARVALGRALLSAPSLLILDEPLAALDAQRKADILPYLERLRDHAGVPMLYITHALDEVARLGSTLVLLQDGKVARTGRVRDVLSDPDAVPVLGPRMAGAMLEGQVLRHVDGLTELAVSGGPLWVPGTAGAIGSRMRLRVMAQDVIVGTQRPQGLSALNILPAQVVSLHRGDGPGALVVLQSGTDRLLARITQRSLDEMGLAPGDQVFGILKTVSVGPTDVFAGMD